MLNYEGIAQIAADYLAGKMVDKILDEEFSTINKAVVTLDFDSKTMTIETERKDMLGIVYKASTNIDLSV